MFRRALIAVAIALLAATPGLLVAQRPAQAQTGLTVSGAGEPGFFVESTIGWVEVHADRSWQLAPPTTSDNIELVSTRCVSWRRTCRLDYRIEADQPGPVSGWLDVSDTTGEISTRVPVSGQSVRGSFAVVAGESVDGRWSFRLHDKSRFGARLEEGKLIIVDPDGGQFPTLVIDPPGDQAVAERSYQSTETRSNITIDGPGCYGTAHSVDVEKLTVDASGRVSDLVVSGQMKCDLHREMHFSLVLNSSALATDLLVAPNDIDHGQHNSLDRRFSSFVHNTGTTALEVSVDIPSAAVDIVFNTCRRAIQPGKACAVMTMPSGHEFGALDIDVTASANARSATARFTAVHNQTTVYQKVGDAYSGFGGEEALFRVDDDGSITIEGRMDGYTKTFILVPADGQPLKPGYYTDVPTVANRRSGMGFQPGSEGCQGPSDINIRDIQWRFDGTISSLSVDFVSRCGLYGVFDGKIRHNAELGGNALQIKRTLDVVPLAYDGYPTNRVEVTNHGPRTTTLGAVRIKGDVNYGYRIGGQDCAGVTLRPGESCHVSVHFMPYGSTANGYPGMLEIEGHTVLGSLKSFFRTRDGYGGNLNARDLENRAGYWLLGSNGEVSRFGDAGFWHTYGSSINAVDIEATPTGRGYWVLRSDGSVSHYGDALSHTGNTWKIAAELEPGEQASAMSSDRTGTGLWVFTDRGRAVELGTAPDLGDLSNLDLAGPIVASSATSTARGLYMLGSDGGVFALGDALFAGSVPQVLPGVTLDAPIVGLVPDPDGYGYWLVAADGGVFAFDAPFRGSIPQVLPPGVELDAPIVAMVAYGNGYLLVGADGGVFNFSDLAFAGSMAGQSRQPFVSIAALPERDGWLDATREVLP